jgi:hypothetical protein
VHAIEEQVGAGAVISFAKAISVLAASHTAIRAGFHTVYIQPGHTADMQ